MKNCCNYLQNQYYNRNIDKIIKNIKEYFEINKENILVHDKD